MKTAAPNLVVTRNVTVKTLLEGLPIISTGQLEGARKSLFHKMGVRFFRDVAIALRLQPSEYRVSNFEMATHESGEVWLHTNSLFLQMGQNFPSVRWVGGPEFAIPYPVKVRRCFAQTDYPARDAPTWWMPLEAIESVTTCRDWILNFKTRLMTGEL